MIQKTTEMFSGFLQTINIINRNGGDGFCTRVDLKKAEKTDKNRNKKVERIYFSIF